MAKSRSAKKAEKSRAQKEREWDDDASSCSSRETGEACSPNYEENPLEFICEALYEKRASVRESALKILVEFLRSSYRYGECDSWKDTLSQQLLSILRKGKAKEVDLASTSITLIVATLGASDWTTGTVNEFLPMLQDTMLNTKQAAAKASATRAYGMLCYIGSDDSETLQTCIGHLTKLVSTANAAAKSEAFNMLALLLSVSAPVGSHISSRMSIYLQSFSKALDDESVEVRGAAGNALVVLNENFGDIFIEDESEDDDRVRFPQNGNETYSNGSAAVQELSNGAEEKHLNGSRDAQKICKDALVDKMNQLATTSWGDESTGKRFNKKERSAQKSTFRHLLGALGGGAGFKEEKIKLKHGDALILESQSHRMVAAAFRTVFASGFQVHIQHNHLLHEIFGYEPRQEKVRLNATQKRMLLSPNSPFKKSQAQQRTKGRVQKNAAKLSFLSYDD
eukprot:CAMPEP_0198239786 /NCGR_PEP_ID=MMETSP1446-20131203/5088_1 /TAXON_ID=1461542 ORGANISM="Unidentified sp, Strain CCMP2111" /NCGR_SAMPLE_ID=MMETSP1446 /ASSEMBLY_ACC=CAM_ASM_001112 /LENGTH=452 /DNA_ID=CAMNT_0043922423 /DNA_START=112 /DNA_END=1470 /DNA_ORIENTATION=+